MSDSEIKYVVIGMLRQKLVEAKLCSTFREAVKVAEELVKQHRVIIENPQILRKLLVTNKACYAFDFSVHIGAV